MAGYHVKSIRKGSLGSPSKIQEELDEYNDAIEQGNKIMAICELADLYGALEHLAKEHNMTMKDLRVMADATARAFQDGTRK